MSDKASSSSKLAVCAVLLLCAGVGAWFAMDGSVQTLEKAVQAAPENIVPASTSTASEAVKSVAEVSTSSAEVQCESKAQQASGALNSGPRPRKVSAEEKRDAKVEQALAAKGRMEGGDSEGGALSESTAQPVKEVKDSVVTPYFVSDLARWMANGYSPEEGGQSKVTLRSANARYSVSPALRSAEKDALKGRKAILRYVYSPGMLEALYRMYEASFLQELESFAHHGRNALGQEQIAGMLRFYADQLSIVANSLDAAAQLDIKALVKPIRQAIAQEEAASDAFAKAYAAHSEARDAGQKEAMAKFSERMVQSIREASEADARKESARYAVTKALKQGGQGTLLPDTELVFLVEWLGRRDASAEAISVSGSICRRLAESMEKRATALLGTGSMAEAQ